MHRSFVRIPTKQRTHLRASAIRGKMNITARRERVFVCVYATCACVFETNTGTNKKKTCMTEIHLQVDLGSKSNSENTHNWSIAHARARHREIDVSSGRRVPGMNSTEPRGFGHINVGIDYETCGIKLPQPRKKSP